MAAFAAIQNPETRKCPLAFIKFAHCLLSRLLPQIWTLTMRIDLLACPEGRSRNLNKILAGSQTAVEQNKSAPDGPSGAL